MQKQNNIELLCENKNKTKTTRFNFVFSTLPSVLLFLLAEFEIPPEGFWKAFFVEFEFIRPDGIKLILSTETMIIPEELPWKGKCFTIFQIKLFLGDSF